VLFAAELGLLDEVGPLDKDEFVALGAVDDAAALGVARLGLLARGVALVAVLLAATLGGIDGFLAFDATDEDVTASRFAAADFSGALGATFPALATVGCEVFDAGSGNALFACRIGDGGCVETIGEASGAGCVAAGFVVCSGEAVAAFDTGASVWAEFAPGFSGGCDESDCWLTNLLRISFRPAGPAAIHPAANESRTTTRMAAAKLFQLRNEVAAGLSTL
jgi:hypothetical protein